MWTVLIIAFVLMCGVLCVAACMMSSQISRERGERAG